MNVFSSLFFRGLAQPKYFSNFVLVACRWNVAASSPNDARAKGRPAYLYRTGEGKSSIAEDYETILCHTGSEMSKSGNKIPHTIL